jgi:hypothetical protein
MTTITQLNSAASLSASDLLAIWSASGGDTRKASLATLVAFLQEQLTEGDSLQTQYASPAATGFSVTIAPTTAGNDVWLLLTPLAGYAAGTIVLPAVATCIDQQEVQVSCTQAVTTLTVSGNGATAVNGAPATLAANGFFRLRFDAVQQSWYRVG